MSVEFAAYEPDPGARPEPFAGRVRQAVPGDAEAIAAISVARNGGDADEALARIRGELGPEWNGERGAVLVAEEDGAVVAFGRLRLAEGFDDVEVDLRPPTGWYLLGVVVAPPHRRRGIARELTRARIAWIAERADACFYFVRATNRASIDLHAPFGFDEVTRRFRCPRTGLEPGDGILYRLDLGDEA